MNKKLLSEIAFYYGTVKMPKGFEIRKDVLVKNVSLSQLYIDVNHDFNREFDKLKTYICDYMRVDHQYNLILKDNWGNYFERNEKTKPLLQLDPVDLKNSADFVCLYGVETDGDTCEITLHYDDNRRKGRTWIYKLKTNNYIIFPSTQLYCIDNKNNRHLNYVETLTFQYI